MDTVIQEGSEFSRLMDQVVTGDADAARRLCEEYGPIIIRAVRRRLHPRLRSKFDSMDFAQDVWASFFGHVVDKYELASSNELVGLLSVMARNKVIQAMRTRARRRRQRVPQEASLEGMPGGRELVRGPLPTPSQIAMSEENWERLVSAQPPVYRRILLLLREGCTHETIAAQLGVSVRTIQRVLRHLRL